MITFFRTVKNNFLNLLLLHFFAEYTTLCATVSGYISSNYIFAVSPFYYNRKYLLKTNLFSSIMERFKSLNLCHGKKGTLLKNKSPVVLKLFYWHNTKLLHLNKLAIYKRVII